MDARTVASLLHILLAQANHCLHTLHFVPFSSLSLSPQALLQSLVTTAQQSARTSPSAASIFDAISELLRAFAASRESSGARANAIVKNAGKEGEEGAGKQGEAQKDVIEMGQLLDVLLTMLKPRAPVRWRIIYDIIGEQPVIARGVCH